MSRNIPLIVVMEGGMVQNIYSPDPEVRFDLVMVDYDLQDGSADDLAELVDAVEQADQLERRYDYAPSIASSVQAIRKKQEGG